MLVSTPTNQLNRRLVGAATPLPAQGDVPYAKCRPELKGFSESEQTRHILDSDAWQEVMVPALDQVETERNRPGRETPIYDSHVLESVLASVAAILSQALYQQGDRDGAWAYADLSQSAADHDVAAAVHWCGTKAKILSERNEPGAAVELASSAVDLASGTDFLDLRGEALEDYAAVLALVERHEEAQKVLREALSCFQQKGNRVSAARAGALLAAID